MRIDKMIDPNEKILWEGKPNRAVFILEPLLDPLLLVLLAITAIMLISIIIFGMNQGLFGAIMVIMIMVILILICVISSLIRYRNTDYIVTDKAAYASDGIFSVQFHMKPFAEMSHIDVHCGILDRIFGSGDVIMSGTPSNSYYRKNIFGAGGVSGYGNVQIRSINEYEEVYLVIKKVQGEVYSDTMFPNEYRPSNENNTLKGFFGKK